MDPVNQFLMALWTEGIVPLMPWNIANIDIFHALFLGDFPCLLQGLDGGGGKMGQSVGGRKAGEVKRGVLSQVFRDPDAHLPDLDHIVI
jgi:hypothetical protein